MGVSLLFKILVIPINTDHDLALGSSSIENWLRWPNASNTLNLNILSVKLFEIVADASGIQSLFSGISTQEKKKNTRVCKSTTVEMMSWIDMRIQSQTLKHSLYSSETHNPVDKTNNNDNNQDAEFGDIDQLQKFEDRVHFDYVKDLKDI